MSLYDLVSVSIFLGVLLGIFAFVKAHCEAYLVALFGICLIAKGLGGLVYGIVYAYYYKQGDTLSLYHDAHQVAQYLLDLPTTSLLKALVSELPNHLVLYTKTGIFETRIFLKISALVLIISNGSYLLITAWFCLCSALVVWWFIAQLHRLNQSYTIPALLAFALWPDMLFWTSGFSKDTFAYACLWGCCAFVLARKSGSNSLGNSIVALVAGVLLFQVKFYLILLPLFLSVFHVVHIAALNLKKALLTSVLSSIVLWLLAEVYLNFRYQLSVYEFFMLNNSLYTEGSPKQALYFSSGVVAPLLNPILALFYTLLVPLTSSLGTLPQICSAFSTMLLLLTITYTLVGLLRLRVPNRVSYLWVAVLLTAFISAICIPIAAPNVGNLVRYRVISASLILFACFVFINIKRQTR